MIQNTKTLRRNVPNYAAAAKHANIDINARWSNARAKNKLRGDAPIE